MVSKARRSEGLPVSRICAGRPSISTISIRGKMMRAMRWPAGSHGIHDKMRARNLERVQQAEQEVHERLRNGVDLRLMEIPIRSDPAWDSEIFDTPPADAPLPHRPPKPCISTTVDLTKRDRRCADSDGDGLNGGGQRFEPGGNWREVVQPSPRQQAVNTGAAEAAEKRYGTAAAKMGLKLDERSSAVTCSPSHRTAGHGNIDRRRYLIPSSFVVRKGVSRLAIAPSPPYLYHATAWVAPRRRFRGLGRFGFDSCGTGASGTPARIPGWAQRDLLELVVHADVIGLAILFLPDPNLHDTFHGTARGIRRRQVESHATADLLGGELERFGTRSPSRASRIPASRMSEKRRYLNRLGVAGRSFLSIQSGSKDRAWS